MNKRELKRALLNGKTLVELFNFSKGDACEIFVHPTWKGEATDEIVYIPCLEENNCYIDIEKEIAVENIEDLISTIWTGNEFLEVCEGNGNVASMLLDMCDWANPYSVLNTYITCSEPHDLMIEANISMKEALQFFE